MLDEVGFRIRAIWSGSFIDRPLTIVNPKQLRIGRRCNVGKYCLIKAGQTRNNKIIIGDDVVVKYGAYISAPYSNIEIGRYCHIGHYSWIGGRGNITIKENTLIAMHVTIISSNHDYQLISVPYYDGQEIAKDIIVGKNVWIGANSVVLPGVNIGDNAVVGAGSVVVSDVEPNSLFAGNPASLIKRLR